MADKPEKTEDVRPIIIKKVKKGGGGHHGGAWKVAYADFVTAMMAFFLLLWLLNVTTKEQKEGIAEFFNPTPKITISESGAGGMLGGLTVSPEGAMTSTKQPITPQESQADAVVKSGADPKTLEEQELREELRKREEESFEEAEAEIKAAINASPELKDLANNIMVDITPEGLRIQIVDQDGKSMFPSGSAEMYDKTRELMVKVAEIIKPLPNDISIRGHTDGVAYGKGATYTNWELSTDRANSSRRVLKDAGLDEKRLNNVVGKADTDHLMVNTPSDARNRRISIILLRKELTTQQGANMSTKAIREQSIDPLYQKSPGTVQFP